MKVLFIERQTYTSTSIERVFAQVARGLEKEGIGVEFQKLPFKSSPLGILGNLLFFKPRAADIYHLTGDGPYMLLRLPAYKTVVTFHDLIWMHTRRGLRQHLLKRFFLDIPARTAKWITAVSRATKDEIGLLYPAFANKVRVIANPLINGFEPGEQRVAGDKLTVLQVGTSSNKNISRLAEALSGQNGHLRIIGPLDHDTRDVIERYDIDFSNVVRVSDDEIITEYENADVVTLCSTYEGFGLPIIEAQAIGTPVVTSSLPPMTDVAGEGAVFVDPLDPISIREGIARAAHGPDRDTIIAAGFRNVERFRSEEICRQYADLYRSIESELAQA